MPALAALVAALVPVLLWVARIVAVSMVLRVLVTLGLSLVAYKYAIGPMVSAARNAATAIPPNLAQWLGLLRFDQAVTIILSAVVIRYAMRAVHLVKS